MCPVFYTKAVKVREICRVGGDQSEVVYDGYRRDLTVNEWWSQSNATKSSPLCRVPLGGALVEGECGESRSKCIKQIVLEIPTSS